MKNFICFLFHELRALFLSPSTYVATVLFLTLMGFLYLLILEDFSQTPQETLPTTEFFKIFWLPLFFIIPLITMKSIAEERRTGTLESLMTTPTSPLAIVFSKFFAAYFLYILLWSITLGFPFITKYILPENSFDARLLDTASIFGGYLFIAVSGVFYVAVGIFSSSLTRSQLIAGTLTFSLLFVFLLGARLLLELPFLDLPWVDTLGLPIIDYFQTFEHLEDFSRGIIDSRPFFFYISSALMLIGVTSLIVEAKA